MALLKLVAGLVVMMMHGTVAGLVVMMMMHGTVSRLVVMLMHEMVPTKRKYVQVSLTRLETNRNNFINLPDFF